MLHPVSPPGLLLALAAALATPPAHAQDLDIEPPLDPLAGIFAAVAYWRGEPAPDDLAFRLVDGDGETVWQTESQFSSDLRRASERCDTAGFPDGAYDLVAAAGGQESRVDLRLRQGRDPLPDARPFRSRMIWMPMTGYTDEQLDDAVAAGYDTVFVKVHPTYAGPGRPIDFMAGGEDLVKKAQARGMKVITAWLLWTALEPGAFWLEKADGTREMGRIDPCWDAAMAQVRQFCEQMLDHYLGCGDVIAIAPTWGIYGEAGYAAFDGGYGPHALAKFNRWLVAHGEGQADRLPDGSDPYRHVLFHRFRFEHNAAVWGELNGHLRRLEPNGLAIGAWQEIYNGHMYQLALNEVPGADFAVNEMCFPWGTTQDQARALGETMGLRYKCDRFEDYRDYYLPLLARRWAEGQQGIGCQLSNAYAEKTYAKWPEGKAAEVEFDLWEDRMAPVIARVRDTLVVPEPADVAYVQMTYPAACYPDVGHTVADINLYEIVLRMWGVSYDRIPVHRLTRLRASDLARYKLIILPGAWYLDEDVWRTLAACGANVLFTGGVFQAGLGRWVSDGESRTFDGLTFTYGKTPGGVPALTEHCPEAVARDLAEILDQGEISLPPDLGLADLSGAEVLLRVGDKPLVARRDRFFFITNRLLYACAHDPDRVIPNLSGSTDVSANEADPWGLASSSSPGNLFGETLLRNLIEQSGARVRIPEPLPRGFSRYLGDHVEPVNVTGNIVVNQDDLEHTLDVICSRPVLNVPCRPIGDHFVASVTVPPYDFVALHYAQ